MESKKEYCLLNTKTYKKVGVFSMKPSTALKLNENFREDECPCRWFETGYAARLSQMKRKIESEEHVVETNKKKAGVVVVERRRQPHSFSRGSSMRAYVGNAL